MKKPFFKTVVGRIVLFVLNAVIKNQRGFKGTERVDIIDGLTELLTKEKRS